MEYFDNPYMTEYLNALKQTQKQKDEIDNWVFFKTIKWFSFLIAISLVFKFFVK